MKQKNIFLITLVVSTSIFMSGCMLLPKEDEKLTPPIIESRTTEYKTEAITFGTIQREVNAFGSFKPDNEEAFSFEERGGDFLQFYFEKNDDIKEGDVIAELHTGDLDKQIRDMEIDLQRARLSFERSTEQYQNKQISEYDYKIAKLSFEKTENKYNDLLLTKEQSQIVATKDGTISYLAPFDEWETVNKGELVFKIILNDAMTLSCSGNGIYKFKMDQDVLITARNYTTTGRITIQNRNNMIVVPDEIYDDWGLGTSVMVTQNLDTVVDVLMVNQKAISNFGGKSFAKILVDGVPVEVEVVLGNSNGVYFEVVSGLKEGDEAVIY